MEAIKLSIKVTYTLTNEVIEDIFVTALEGGSNYWYYLAEDSVKAIREKVSSKEDECLSTAMLKAISKGANVPIYDVNDEDELLGTINANTLRANLQKLADNRFYNHHLVDMINGDGDAETADVCFQFIVLGEVQFG